MEEIMVVGAARVFSVILLLFFAIVLASASRVAAAEKLELEMTVNKDIVPMGQQVSFTLILTNVGNKNVTIEFGTSQAFDLSYSTTTGWYRWSYGQYFFPLVWEVTLRPGENFSQTLQWNLYQYNSTTGKFLQPEFGAHDVLGTCVGVPGTHTASPTTVKLVVPGDVNADGIVNILDAAGVSAHWYPGPPIGPLGFNSNLDINNDNAVDIQDAAIVSAYWTGPPKGPLDP